jgi:NAD(P)-dependent dehydrogenase (short-subunit alcohol dehydrogenase family)
MSTIGSRGPSPMRPGFLSGQASFRPDEEMSPIDDDMHPVVHAGRVAVITGAASGIGRAAAKELARRAPPVVSASALLLIGARRLGLRIAIADVDEAALEAVGKEVAAIQGALPPELVVKTEGETLLVLPTDVRDAAAVVRLRDRVYEAWDEVRAPRARAAV